MTWEPLEVAFPLARLLTDIVRTEKRTLILKDIVRSIKSIGMEEVSRDEGWRIFEGKGTIAIVWDELIIDILPKGGGIEDAIEVIVHEDRKNGILTIELLPADTLHFENLGVEPALFDLKSYHLLSCPVFGELKEGKLIIDEETFKKWKECKKIDVCPFCGGHLRWRGNNAVSMRCDYMVVVKSENNQEKSC